MTQVDPLPFRSIGQARPAAAAAIALRRRAIDWELTVAETGDGLLLRPWGASLRLRIAPAEAAARIELAAPEPRMIGYMQDSLAELFEAEGIEVAWEEVAVGALAPGLARMRVVSVTAPSPGFLRVRLAGAEAARFGTGSLHFRLLLPPRGRAPVWPRVGQNGRVKWPEGADALHRPVYTVAAQEGETLDFDIFRHPGSPTCDWVEAGPEGQEIALIGPGGGWCPEGAPLLLFGDETALPAIARLRALATGPVQARVRAAAADLGPLAGDPRVALETDLLAALRETEVPPGAHVWFAAGTAEARAARAHLAERGLARRDVTVAAYWS